MTATRVFYRDTEGGRVMAYQAALNEGRTVDQVELLNRDLLIEIWPELMLPVRVRTLWEGRFPELAATPDPRNQRKRR